MLGSVAGQEVKVSSDRSAVVGQEVKVSSGRSAVAGQEVEVSSGRSGSRGQQWQVRPAPHRTAPTCGLPSLMRMFSVIRTKHLPVTSCRRIQGYSGVEAFQEICFHLFQEDHTVEVIVIPTVHLNSVATCAHPPRTTKQTLSHCYQFLKRPYSFEKETLKRPIFFLKRDLKRDLWLPKKKTRLNFFILQLSYHFWIINT